MAFSPSKTLQGITVHSRVSENMIVWMPGDPGVTYTKGKFVSLGAGAGTYGVAIVAADSVARAIGRVHKTVVCPAAATPFPIPGSPPLDLDGDTMKTLIPIEISRPPAGTQILKGRAYLNARDEAVTAYTKATRRVLVTTGPGNDFGMGSLIYVYDGPGKGECNIVEDYDHTGGASEKMMTLHRPFNVDLTSASKILWFTNSAHAADGIPPIGGLMDLDEASATTSEFDTADGYDDGNYETLMDWWLLGGLLADGAFLAVQRTDSP